MVMAHKEDNCIISLTRETWCQRVMLSPNVLKTSAAICDQMCRFQQQRAPKSCLKLTQIPYMYSLSHSWTGTQTQTHIPSYSDTFTVLHSKQRANMHSLQRVEVICWSLTTTTGRLPHTHTEQRRPKSPRPKRRSKRLAVRIQRIERKKQGRERGPGGEEEGYRTNQSEKKP